MVYWGSCLVVLREMFPPRSTKTRHEMTSETQRYHRTKVGTEASMRVDRLGLVYVTRYSTVWMSHCCTKMASSKSWPSA